MCERCSDVTEEEVRARVKDATSVLIAGAICCVLLVPVIALLRIKVWLTRERS